MEIIKQLFESTTVTYYEKNNIVKDIINRDDIDALEWLISTKLISTKKHICDDSNILDYAKHKGSMKITNMLENKYNLQPINQRFTTLTSIIIYLINEDKINISDDLLKNVVKECNNEAIYMLFEKCGKKQKIDMLQYTIEYGKLDVAMRLVVEKKLISQHSERYDLLKYLVDDNKLNIIKFLVDDCGLCIGKYEQPLFTYMIDNDKLNMIQFIINHINYSIELWHQQFVYMVDTNKLNVIKFLIEVCRIKLPENIVLVAIKFNKKLILKYIIEDCKIVPTNNMLKIAIQNVCFDVVKYLIEECKIKPTEELFNNWDTSNEVDGWDDPDNDCMTMIKYLIEECKMVITEKLLKISYHMSFYILRYLIEDHKLDPKKEVHNGYNLLGYIASDNRQIYSMDCVEYLIEKCGMDPKETIYGGHNLITHTMRYNKKFARDILAYIIRRDFDIQINDMLDD